MTLICRWASRWDTYMAVQDEKIRWLRYWSFYFLIRQYSGWPFAAAFPFLCFNNILLLFELLLQVHKSIRRVVLMLVPLCVRSIANSIVIIVFLSFMVGMILMRTVYRDIARYNRIPLADKEDEVEC